MVSVGPASQRQTDRGNHFVLLGRCSVRVQNIATSLETVSIVLLYWIGCCHDPEWPNFARLSGGLSISVTCKRFLYFTAVPYVSIWTRFPLTKIVGLSYLLCLRHLLFLFFYQWNQCQITWNKGKAPRDWIVTRREPSAEVKTLSGSPNKCVDGKRRILI